ncbi:MAG: 3'-5' exonuclease [Oligoflexales bacterium]
MKKNIFVDKIYNDDQSVVVKEFKALPQYLFDQKIEMREDLGFCVLLDTETTGLDYRKDEIIEIAVRKWIYHKKEHCLIKPLEEYSALQEPIENILSEKITKITGITQEDLKDQRIDWDIVSNLFNDADFILAHNAGFDRPMVESVAEITKLSESKIWTCSLKQVDWENLGFLSAKQEILSVFHGFYYSGHRGLIDIDALANLIIEGDYLKAILANAKIQHVQINCIHAPFKSKDLLKSKGFSWNSARKFWTKSVAENELEEMKIFLTDQVYHQDRMAAEFIPVKIKDRFRAEK